MSRDLDLDLEEFYKLLHSIKYHSEAVTELYTDRFERIFKEFERIAHRITVIENNIFGKSED